LGQQTPRQQEGEQQDETAVVRLEHRKNLPQSGLNFDYMNMWVLVVF
jgi:hypothetical protein